MLQEHLPDQLQHIQPTKVQACTVSKTALPLSGALPITFQLGSPNNQITIKHYCLISPTIQHPILGQDFLSRATAITISSPKLLLYSAINKYLYQKSIVLPNLEPQLFIAQGMFSGVLSVLKFSGPQWQAVMSLLRKSYHSFFHDREIGCISIKPVSIQLTTQRLHYRFLHIDTQNKIKLLLTKFYKIC